MTNQNNEKSKNGKRLALILIALLLIVAVAFGAYTYSRYVSRQNGTGSATVAMWGFSATINPDNEAAVGDDFGFHTSYDSTGEADNSGTAIVKSTTRTKGNIVAPGAKGQLVFTYGGTAEVLASLDIALTVNSDISLTLSNEGQTVTLVYSPIKFAYGDSAATVDTSYTYTAAALATELNKLDPTSIAAGTSVTSTKKYIDWMWAFQGGDDISLTATKGSTEATFSADELDTVLGSISSSYVNNPDSATVPANTTVTDSTGAPWNVTAVDLVFDISLSISFTQIQA